MQIEIDEKEYELLTQLVESQIRELHPMIRRCRVYRTTDALKDDLRTLEQFSARLKQLADASYEPL